MNKEDFQLSDIVTRYPFFLHYKGNYKDNLTLKIVDIVEANLSLYFKKFIVNRLSYLVIESVQNIERYSAGTGSFDDFCYIFSDQNYFHVITQNRIENINIEKLKSRLDNVNSKNHEELKQIYMDALTSGIATEKGAGLGLIDIARKSKNSLAYEFHEISDEFSFYRLHVKIPILDNDSPDTSEDNTSELVNKLSQVFQSNKNTLFYSGDFSNVFLQSILAMLSNVKKTDNLPTTSIFKYAIIELTQNTKRHGSKVEGKVPGYLCLEWQTDKAFISTFNFIGDKDAVDLEKKLIRLNGSSIEGLKEDSEEFMTDFSLKGGLGLIDIARLNWPNKIQYKFENNPKFGRSIFVKIQFNYG